MGRDRQTEPVAPALHTFVLCAILLAIAAGGWLTLRATGTIPAQPPGVVALYLGLIAAELALLLYVWLGVRRRGGIRALITDRPLTSPRILADVILGILLLGLLYGTADLLTRLLGPGDVRLVKPLVSIADSQPLLWIVLSLIAGISEELTFRGYLQRQFLAWSGSPLAAIVGQAVLFGVSHGYQGGLLIAKITVLALLLGVVAHLRRSRIPGVVAHFGLDVAGGLLGAS